jgi:hypothetical protein
MKIPTLLSVALLSAALALASGATARAESAAGSTLPHLEKRGAATQLVVDGRPWLIRGGEIANTASSSLPYMETVWPKMTRLNLNTVLVSVAWAWVEPVEGKFDFSLVDGLLDGARKNHQRIIFLWFGSWKNGVSSFAPAWVKSDSARFPRTQVGSGHSVEVLSPFGSAALDADTRAYVKFMEHLRAVDPQHTVIMIQMQNEVGLLGDSRDRGAAATAAFARPVPAELTAYLSDHAGRLSPALAETWRAAGEKTSGSWAEVFGSGVTTDEIFMAWHYARYLGHIAAAGKAVLPLPVFTNTWIVQPEDKVPGDYPSGGPEPLVLDIWKAGAPSIDLNCPDIYLSNFDDWTGWFHRPDNPLFVPESRGDAAGVANAFYAIGAHAALGYSPFGIDNTARLQALRPAPGTPQPSDLENLPLARGYALLRDLTPLILEHHSAGTIRAAWLTTGKPSAEITLNGYRLHVSLRRSSRDQSFMSDLGYGLVFALGPDEFLVAGENIQVTFAPLPPGPPIAGIADAETGVFADGHWTPGRKMSGDDILLNYHLAQQAAQLQSGSGLRFGPDGPSLQRVKLYRYR